MQLKMFPSIIEKGMKTFWYDFFSKVLLKTCIFKRYSSYIIWKKLILARNLP